MLKFLVSLIAGFVIVSKLTDWIADAYGMVPAAGFFLIMCVAAGLFFGVGALVRYTGWDPIPRKRR